MRLLPYQFLLLTVLLTGCTGVTMEECSIRCKPNAILSFKDGSFENANGCVCAVPGFNDPESQRKLAEIKAFERDHFSPSYFCAQCKRECGERGMAKCVDPAFAPEECWCGDATRGQNTQVDVKLGGGK